MVTVDHILRCVTCTTCGQTRELSRYRSPESFITEADHYAKHHNCASPQRRKTVKPVDRWKSLFADIKF